MSSITPAISVRSRGLFMNQSSTVNYFCQGILHVKKSYLSSFRMGDQKVITGSENGLAPNNSMTEPRMTRTTDANIYVNIFPSRHAHKQYTIGAIITRSSITCWCIQCWSGWGGLWIRVSAHPHGRTIGWIFWQYSDVIMSSMASLITGVSSVCLTVYSGADQRKHQRSASLDLVGRFPSQRVRDTENISIWWCHHGGLGVSSSCCVTCVLVYILQWTAASSSPEFLYKITRLNILSALCWVLFFS